MKLRDNGYTFVEELPISELSRFKDHRRLTVFYHKGTKCANPTCNHIGTRLLCGKDKGGSLHWDVYTEDLIMMTVDHIFPKSKGGGEELSNKNPMCRPCNTSKSDKVTVEHTVDPVFKGIMDMRNRSNKIQQLLKNLISTKKFNSLKVDNLEYYIYMKATIDELRKHSAESDELTDKLIKMCIEKGVFTFAEFFGPVKEIDYISPKNQNADTEKTIQSTISEDTETSGAAA